MDKVEQYRKLIIERLEYYARFKPAYGDIEMELIFDREHDHYHLMTVGWKNYERFHGSVLHIDIRDGQIWIQHDGTENGLANELVERGVPKEDIVLAYHAPYKRKFTGFSTGEKAA
ncbi:MAG: XisI protein [Thiothrix nivea]|nr:MAG: XisI protein [Thiothrix nivea]